MSLVKRVELALGTRKRMLTEDQYQTFWVGVMKAYKDADPSRDIIPYLIMRGFGEVRNELRRHWSYEHYKYCPECGSMFVYRKHTCSKCQHELISDWRHVEYIDHQREQHDPTDKLFIEQFVLTLVGPRRYVAKRWLLDRADLMCENHIKQIAFELGVTEAAVAKHKRKIKQAFLVFLHG